jgi:hypothetical protein
MHSCSDLEDGYMGSGKRLRRSLNKYGIENHTKVILEFLPDRESLSIRESEIVNERSIEDPLCMNLKPGGFGGFSIEQQKLNAHKSNERQKWLMENDKEWAESRINKLKQTGSLTFMRLHAEGKIKPYDWTGRTHTEETKLKIRTSSKGNGSSVENSQYGTCWITNGIDNKKIHKGDLIPEGWKLGRKIKK